MMVNERKAIQSRLYKNESVLPQDVWGLYLTAPFFTTQTTEPGTLLLRLGSGSAARYFHRYFSDQPMTGVEIDGHIIDTGRRFYGLDRIPMTIVQADARTFLTHTDAQYAVIVADAFRFPYLPAHLSTVEFMALVKSRLKNGGVVLFNVGYYRQLDDTVTSMSDTALEVFDYVYAYALPNQMNTLLYCMNHPIEDAWEDPKRPAKLRLMARRVKRKLQQRHQTGTLISTDDRPLAEWLTHRIILEAFGII